MFEKFAEEYMKKNQVLISEEILNILASDDLGFLCGLVDSLRWRASSLRSELNSLAITIGQRAQNNTYKMVATPCSGTTGCQCSMCMSNVVIPATGVTPTTWTSWVGAATGATGNYTTLATSGASTTNYWGQYNGYNGTPQSITEDQQRIVAIVGELLENEHTTTLCNVKIFFLKYVAEGFEDIMGESMWDLADRMAAA